MKNILDFENGYQAVIQYDPEIDSLRGEFIGLNGGADFYANSLEELKIEGNKSLSIFLQVCEEKNIQPHISKGNFALRLDPETYKTAQLAAASQGKSLNKFIAESIRNSVSG